MKKKTATTVVGSAELIAYAKWFPNRVVYFWDVQNDCVGVRKIVDA